MLRAIIHGEQKTDAIAEGRGMSLRPDHVEAARPGLRNGLFARVAALFDADLVRKRADWALMERDRLCTVTKRPDDGAGRRSYGTMSADRRFDSAGGGGAGPGVGVYRVTHTTRQGGSWASRNTS